MMPWYGVLLCCFGFAIWTAICIMVGAAIAMQSKKPATKYQKAGIVDPERN